MPERRNWLRRLFASLPPAYGNRGHVSITPTPLPSQRPTPQPPRPVGGHTSSARPVTELLPPPTGPAPGTHTVDTLDDGALHLADAAFIDERSHGATSASALRYALIAYRWALVNRNPHPLGITYPSLQQWRTYRATL